MVIRKVALTLAGLMHLAACAMAVAAPPIDQAAIARLPGDRLIVRGQRVGPLRLGAGVDQALAVLGKPAAETTKGSCLALGAGDCQQFRVFDWSQLGLKAFALPADKPAVIVAIEVSGGALAWHLAEGVSLATPYFLAVNNGLGPSTMPGNPSICSDEGGCVAFGAEGIRMTGDSRNVLTAIAVFDAGLLSPPDPRRRKRAP